MENGRFTFLTKPSYKFNILSQVKRRQTLYLVVSCDLHPACMFVLCNELK